MTAPLNWTLKDVVAATGGTLVGPSDAVVRCVGTDSRAIQPGEVFVAIRGEQFDGNEFAAAALDAGAVAVVVETGTGDAFAAAAHLYERLGFRAGGPFADYVDNGFSRFFTLRL